MMTPRDQGLLAVTTDSQSEHEELVGFLEPDQLVNDKARPVARAHLSGSTRFWLWVLRVFVVVVAVMVIWTFVAQLRA